MQKVWRKEQKKTQKSQLQKKEINYVFLFTEYSERMRSCK